MRLRLCFGIGVLVVCGLVIRIILLTSGGTHDVAYDVAWGHATNRAGFADYYYGNYFPIQYHVFQFVDWLSGALDIGGPTVLKAVDLVFDVGLLGVIVLLTRRLHLPGHVAWIYWLAPYTLAMDWLGYVDFQMAFFALLGVLLVAWGRRVPGLLAAGFAFGIALMMKPQALVLAVVFVGLVCVGWAWSKQRQELLRDAALLAVGPLALFVGYSVWLASAGHRITWLAKTLVNFGNFQGPSLSANMTNIWMVFAQAQRQGTQPIYQVVGPHYDFFQAVGAMMTGALTIAGIFVGARRIDDRPLHESLIAVFAMGTLTLPMTMTRAHENHLFLGVVFGLVAGALFAGRVFSVALQIIITLQFVTLVSLYQFGQTGPHWSFLVRSGAFFLDHLWAAAGALTFVAFCVAYSSLLLGVLTSGWTANATGDGGPRLPVHRLPHLRRSVS